MPAAALIPAKPMGANGSRLLEEKPLSGDHDEQDQHAHLDQHHDGVGVGRFPRPTDQQQAAHEDQDDGGQIEIASPPPGEPSPDRAAACRGSRTEARSNILLR